MAFGRPRRKSRRVLVLGVIAAVVAAVYFAPLGDWLAENPLPGQAWMKDHLAWAVLVCLVVGLIVAGLNWVRQEDAATGGAGKEFDLRNDRRLGDLRASMRKIWIDDFLDCSLERMVPAILGFTERPDAIAGPMRLVGRRVESIRLAEGTSIADAFEDSRSERRLVLLGAPGAGKTTQLLRLAEHLLDDEDGPVPVVLSLSTGAWKIDPYEDRSRWRPTRFLRRTRTDKQLDNRYERFEKRRQRAEEKARKKQIARTIEGAVGWLVDEISYLYKVPERTVEEWLRAENCPIVLLMDGLDEIRDKKARNRCVAALSLLRVKLSAGMVVCSRTVDYDALEESLEFGRAVEIEGLSAEDVDRYLRDAGPRLASLRAACRHNAALSSLLGNPLALSVAVLTYAGQELDRATVKGLVSNRLGHLWSAYLRKVLPRLRTPVPTMQNSAPPFEVRETLRYLRGVARLMESSGQDSFKVEDLNRDWASIVLTELKSSKMVAFYWWGTGAVAAALAVFAAKATSLSVGVLALIILLCTAFGQLAICAVRGGLDFSKLEREEFVSREWAVSWLSGMKSVYVGTGVGLVLGGALGLLAGASGLLLGFVPAFASGVAAGLMNLPVRGNRDQSFRTTLPAGRTLVVRVGFALAAMFFATMIVFGAWWIASADLRPLLVVLAAAVVLGVWLPRFGVSMHGWWSHRTAFTAIVEKNYVPRELEEFLHHAEERIVMRRSLTGHMFLHRTLQAFLVEGPSGRSKWSDEELEEHVFPPDLAA